MRILIATHHHAVVGGIETHLRAVLPLLQAAGHELTLLAEEPLTTLEAGILAHCPDVLVLSASGASSRKTLQEVAAWAPDVVYQHGLTNAELTSALAQMYPSILYAHAYFGTCISGSKCHSMPGPKICERIFGPACLAIYPFRGCGGRNPITMIGRYRQQRAHQQTLGQHRMIFVASQHMAQEYARHRIQPDQLKILPLFPTEVVPDPEPPPRRPLSGRIIFSGRLTRLKGLDHLIAVLPAASKVLRRQLTLIVAGEGPDRARLEAQASAAGIQAQFLGWINAERRNAELRAADLLVIPSIWPEPFGLVGIEAGCVGLPAVGYAVGGIPDWLIPGFSGESASGDVLDPNRLAAALVRALQDELHWNVLRQGAWKVAQRFTSDRHVRDLQIWLSQIAR